MTKYEWVAGMRLGLERFAFKPEASDNLVFKSILQGCLTLYCNERFKSVIESIGLTGLAFDSNLLPESFNTQ